MYLEIIAAAFLAGQYAYHRIFDKAPRRPDFQFQVPLTAKGSTISLVYGRVRVRKPVLAMASPAYLANKSSWSIHNGSDATYIYAQDQFFVIGIPFKEGINRIWNIYSGDFKNFGSDGYPVPANLKAANRLQDLRGKGNHERPAYQAGSSSIGTPGGAGLVEFLDGNQNQFVVDPNTGDPLTFTADRLSSQGYGYHTPDPTGLGTIIPRRMPSFRGYMSAFLFQGVFGPDPNNDPSLTYTGWPDNYMGYPQSDDPSFIPHLRHLMGETGGPPTWSFEVASYPETPLHQNIKDPQNNFWHANPADIIWDIFKSKFGKLGLGSSTVDSVSFTAAALRLTNEGHCCSIVFDQTMECEDMVREICRQIDAVVYHDPFDNLIKIRLIRADYVPAQCLEVNESNCIELKDVSIGGWTGLTNKIELFFTDSRNHYLEGRAIAFTQSNSVNEGNEINLVQLRMPGVPTLEVANQIVNRERAAICRPLSRYRVKLNRSFVRLVEGDVLRFNFPPQNLFGLFRVGAVTRGTLDDGAIGAELIQEYFYEWHGLTPNPDVVPGGPGDLVA